MAERRELEELSEVRDDDDICDNAGAIVDVQPGSVLTDQAGMTSKKGGKLRKITHRMRDPFNKKKVKELKQENRNLKTAVGGLSKKMLAMITTHTRGENIIGAVGNLQIDCINNISNDSVSDFDELQEAIDKLTDAANELLEQLSTENKVRRQENADIKGCYARSETKLGELKDLVLQCSSKIIEQDVRQIKALKDLKDLEEALVTDMSDAKLASDGISAIRLGLVFDHEYDFLPFQTKLLVTRLLHLFGHKGLVCFCEAMHIQYPEDVLAFGDDGQSKTSEGGFELLLNKDVCANILVDWVNKSLSNDSTVLLQVMQAHERKRYGQTEQNMTAVYCSHDDKSVQTGSTDEELFQVYYRSLSNLEERCDNSSSDKSLSIDDNYFHYSSLEREALQLLKIISVEGIIVNVT